MSNVIHANFEKTASLDEKIVAAIQSGELGVGVQEDTLNLQGLLERKAKAQGMTLTEVVRAVSDAVVGREIEEITDEWL